MLPAASIEPLMLPIGGTLPVNVPLLVP